MASISFVSVSKRYADIDAVTQLDLACDAGEMLALLGPSGCGKTTTLKMAAGIESPSSGEIYFGDRPVSALPPGQRNIAMVFEDYALYPRMTVRANIAFPLRLRGRIGPTAASRIDEVLQLLGLEDIAESDVQGLSGGAQQRVAIGRALVRDPEVILFDEPLSHLDAAQKVQLRTGIKRLQKLRKVTSILVTHDQTEAIAMADRVAVMNHGVLQQLAPPQVLYERPANLFVANFIGEPPMNLLSATCTAAGGLVGRGWSAMLAGQRASAVAARPGLTVTAGIRPEHVRLHPPGDAGEIPATIFYREPRGDSDVLTLRIEGQDESLVVETAGPAPWRAGQAVGVSIDPTRLIVFDTATGRNFDIAA